MLNSIKIQGNLGADPELKKSKNDGAPFATFTLYNNETKDKTNTFNCTIFGNQVEYATQNLKKGMQIIVEGVMSGRPYDDNGQKRVYWGVRVQRWHYCGKKSENSGESQTVQAQVEDIFGA